MSHVHQVWPKPSCKAHWKKEEDKADRGRGGKTTSGNGQAWSSPSPRGPWRTGENGGNWLRNHLWCHTDPRGSGIDEMREKPQRHNLPTFRSRPGVLCSLILKLCKAHTKKSLLALSISKKTLTSVTPPLPKTVWEISASANRLWSVLTNGFASTKMFDINGVKFVRKWRNGWEPLNRAAYLSRTRSTCTCCPENHPNKIPPIPPCDELQRLRTFKQSCLFVVDKVYMHVLVLSGELSQ